MATVREAVEKAAEAIAAAAGDEPRADAEALVADALGIEVEGLFEDGSGAIAAEQARAIEERAARRAEHEPLAYILGHERFRGLDIAVDSRVLIPRRETGLLVEAAAELPDGARVHEIGTGSGAVALALLNERPDLRVTASDLSPEAAEVARENAARLGIDLGQADVLDRYQRWRRFDTMAMGLATNSLNLLFSNESTLLRTVRDIGLGLVDRAPPLKNLFIRQAAGLSGEVPRLLRGEAL